jgi:hypothetical protein
MHGVVCTWSENGTSIFGHETSSDLFMKPKENAIWVNVYKRSDGSLFVGPYFNSEAEAKEKSLGSNYIKTVKIDDKID